MMKVLIFPEIRHVLLHTGTNNIDYAVKSMDFSLKKIVYNRHNRNKNNIRLPDGCNNFLN